MLLLLVACVVFLAPSTAKQVHVVFGNHLDIGFDNIEPYIGYDSNVLNMYFNRYLPLAVDMADYMQRVSPHKDRYIYTTHSYVISLFLECPDNMGLQCPSAATKSKVLRGIQEGAITWHAHPHNAQYELYDPSLLEFSFDLTHNLDKRFGFKPKHTAILRDVPGLSRAAIPIMVKKGIKAVSVGVNAGSAPPGVPHYTPFIWRDEASDTEILAFWHPGGYGGIHGGVYLDPPEQCIQAPGLDHVLCTAWRNDNEGPPQTVLEPLRVYQLLRQEWKSSSSSSSSSGSSSSSTHDQQATANLQHSHSNIFASSFDHFVEAVLDAVATKGLKLPVITAEIGDTWIFGVQSDPLKTANFRAVSRARAACFGDPGCPSESAAFYEFSRLLLKVPEHTWGVDVKKTLHDFTNYSNADFHQCIQQQQQQQQQPTPSVQLDQVTDAAATAAGSSMAGAAAAGAAGAAATGSSKDGDGVPLRNFQCLNYEHCIHSWDRQAAYIDWALKALPADHPVVTQYTADLNARKELAGISREKLIAAGARPHSSGTSSSGTGGSSSSMVVSSSTRGSSSSNGLHGQEEFAYQPTDAAQCGRTVLTEHPQKQHIEEPQLQQEQQQQKQQQQRQYTCGSWQFTLDESKGGLTSLRKLYNTDQPQPHAGVDWAGSSSSSSSDTSFRKHQIKKHLSAKIDPRLQDGCQLGSSAAAADAAAAGSAAGAGSAVAAGAAAAAGSSGGVLGQLRYSAYCEASYDFVWKYYAWQQPLSWWFPLDFGKVNSSAVWNKEVHVTAKLQNVYEVFTPANELQQLTLQYTLPEKLIQNVGAPQTMWTVITCPNSTAASSSSSSSEVQPTADDDLQIAVVWQNKTATRLPEALWFSFVPDPGAIDVDSWKLNKLGTWISPMEVILNGSQSMHAVTEAGIQVHSADHSEVLQIKTLDTALVSPGRPNPFPNGAFAPCMQDGMHFNLLNNIWGTNYVMWVPYGDGDVNMAFRFSIHAEQVQQEQQQQQQQMGKKVPTSSK